MWKHVIGYEGLYLVSDDGLVKSLPRWSEKQQRMYGDNVLVQSAASHGYKTVALCRGGTQKTASVHVMVLEAFVGPRPHWFDACHKDGDKNNNALWNLRWASRSDNNLDLARRGQQKSGHKLTKHDVREIRSSKLPDRDLAKMYGVNRRHICSIKRGDVWRHV